MSIERAEADLERARSDATRLQAQLATLNRKIDKLENYIEMARVYLADDNDEPGKNRRDNGPPQVQAVIEILREAKQRLLTRSLVEELERRGHYVGGSNKITNLSSALSRSPALESNRSEGWALKEWIEQVQVAKSEDEQIVASRGYDISKYRPSSRLFAPDDEVKSDSESDDLERDIPF